jgi:flagellar hook-associated protein 1 FlgK
MGSILNIGARALVANELALQTAGNNIANVNTPGYSRQSVILQAVPGQFSANGYFGKGVEVATVQRAHSEYLTNQAIISGSVSAADSKRLDQLKQLEDIFQGGPTGLGAAVSDMLNSFSDIVGAPSDLTARSVVLTRADEMAARFRDSSTRMDDLRLGVRNALQDAVIAVNTLAGRIAVTNQEVARAFGTGQSPNDLLDQRDQLITELNKYVQTTSIEATDGTLGIFVGGSQPLVLGKVATPLRISDDEFGDPAKSKLIMQRGTATNVIEEATLGGGSITGLLRFQNKDLIDAKNLLGRMTLAIGTTVNDQHKLGLDLSGAPGGDLFRVNALPDGLASNTNTGAAAIQVAIQTTPTSGATVLAASNYVINFTGAGAGNITRESDGQITAFAASPITVDGLSISITGAAAAGDRFLVTPFSDASSTFSTTFSTPRALAIANPVSASAGATNQGTLALDSLVARSVPAPAAITISFTAPSTYTRSDTGATTYTYTPGQAIDYDLLSPGATGWTLKLKGSALAGDTYTVQPNAFPRLSAGNAEAMMALRDVAMFDGAVLTDGYASAMSEIGVRVQSAGFAADVSQSIATNMEKERTSVSGVNLDEEAAKLIQYQQSYQASAKMMQIAQGLFETLSQVISG